MLKTFTLLVITLTTLSFADAQLTIRKTFYHMYAKSELTDSSRQDFENFSQRIKGEKIKSISIKSYTDKAGSAYYNMELSKQRNSYLLQLLQSILSQDIDYETGYFGEDSLLTQMDREQDKNRRTEIIIKYKNKEESQPEPAIKLVPYTEDVQEQRYEVNLDDSVVIKGKEGTMIQFAPGTFQNRKQAVATGKATLFIKEYYQPSDILLSSMNSVSPEGLLQTGGMFKVWIVQNKDTMMAETKKPVTIKMPVMNVTSGSMNVFTSNHGDTSLWNDTRKIFTLVKGAWNWPQQDGKLKNFNVDTELPFLSWKTGRRWSEEYKPGTPFIYFGDKKNLFWTRKAVAKTVSYTIVKRDSVTLSVTLSEKFRRFGYKRFAVGNFDTAFLVTYTPSFYQATFSDLNFINCDHFLGIPQTTDFYVKTSGFQGATLLVYFKKLNAFIPVGLNGTKYEVKRVPDGENVYLIAVGKKGDDFYYGKKIFTISKNATADVAMQKVNYDDMKKMFVALGYDK